MDSRRSQRVADAIQEDLEEILNYELEDPRIRSVGIVEVLLSRDGRRAVARVSPEGTTEEQYASLAALNGASGHVRHLLAKRLDLFRTPNVLFEAAIDPASKVKVNQLLRRVRRGRPRD